MADYEKLKHYLITERGKELPALKDCFDLCLATNDHECNKSVRRLANESIRNGGGTEALELYWKTHLFDAKDNFDSFMLYTEHNRPLEQQFWLPRRGKLLHICNALQDLEDDKLDELFLSQGPRTGKALADDTPILTRDGWKNHGDLQVGDEVIGMNGEFKKVIAVHPKCQLDVMVEFTNGEKIQCHENHEWRFYDSGRFRERLEETKYYETRKLENGPKGKRGHRYIFQLPKHGYVVGEEKDLPLDPYLLGVWLGDGANKNPRICNADKDKAIIDKIVENGYTIRWETRHKITGVMYYDFDIRKELQSFGMCHSRRISPKHIPEQYLTASVQQRLDLIAGLIDTDGTYIKKEKRYRFATCEETLRDSFVELISTFGWRASVMEYAPKVSTSGINGRSVTYVIGFNPDCAIPCALERKQNNEFSKYRAISLKSITRVAPKQGNCITVEGDGMYLAGRTMVPTHNTTLIVMFISWVMGRDSERSNLYCSYTDSVVGAFYSGVVTEVLGDKYTYSYYDVFPSAKIVSTNAKDLTMNLDRKKRYASLTGRSLYGTLNGACDCNGYLIADDLISGIEEAMNKDRLTAAWAKVDNNLLPRGKESAKNLWIGTRWSLVDPQGKRIELLENEDKYKNRRWKVINTPALDENDESNFEYSYGVGFSTEYYQQRRASFERNNDMASWLAQYQGEPIEREGTVFSPDQLRYFNGELPEETPDRRFMAVDPAWGGGDYVAAPICYQYGEDIYVVDVIFDNSEKNITQPNIAKAIKKYNVAAVKVEGTKMTASYGEGVDEMLRKDGIRVNMQINTSHFTGNGKRQRIFDKAPEIRERMIFLADGHRSKEYQQFMTNVFSFTITGKQAKNDDACDSLAMAIDYATYGGRLATVGKSPFSR